VNRTTQTCRRFSKHLDTSGILPYIITMRVCVFVFVCATLLLTLFFGTGCGFSRQTIYSVPRTKVASPPPTPLEEVILKGSSGYKLVGWLSRTTPHDDSTPVFLYFHGSGENLQTVLGSRIFGEFASMGVHFFAIDYPGYGNSGGTPSEKSLIEAADTAFKWISRNFPPNPKFVCGWSMGAAVAVQTALNNLRDINGVVLISAWATYDSVAANRFPKWINKKMLKDHFNTIEVISSLEVPTLMLHGEFDRRISINQSKSLSSNCPQLKKWVLLKGTGHNDALGNRRVWDEIEAFVKNPEIDWTARE